MEEKDHGFLDNILEDRGLDTIPSMDIMKGDWETDAYTENKDIMKSKMRTYLNNTNLLSKMNVSATSSVEPHPHESELLVHIFEQEVNVEDRQDVFTTNIVFEKSMETQNSETKSMETHNNISLSKNYISNGKSIKKRLSWDEWMWWLPPTRSTSRRSRWPASGSPRSLSSTCSQEVDPGRSDNLIIEHMKHKHLWKSPHNHLIWPGWWSWRWWL